MSSLIISSASPHHLTYSSIIHPTSSSYHPHSIPSFSHFSLFHSFISPLCSSRFPQNSFSLISFSILFYSLFHPPFHPISLPSPSSPLFPGFQFHSHLCFYSFISIHSHPILPNDHFSHTHSYPFPFNSSNSIPLFSFIFDSSFDSSFLNVQRFPALHYRHSFISSISILIPLSSSSLSYSFPFFASHIRFSTMNSILVCSDTR